MSDSSKIPSSLFTTRSFRPQDQFDAWRQSISVIFDVEPLADHDRRSGFDATVQAYHLGELLISRVEFDGQQFVRDRQRAAIDGLDHYLVHLYSSGGLVGAAGERVRELRPGDIQILDLTQHNATHAAPSGTVAMVVPRDALREALPGANDLHALVLRGDSAPGGLLSDYMTSLLARADGIALADANRIAQATTGMIAACFHSTTETRARARSVIETTILDRICRYIAANLASPVLTVQSLCALFRISRTQLYRMFEPLGGVANYIQERRLRRAHAELCNPAHDHRRIYDIAFNLGFTSEAHFSRLFRATYGLSPSDVRASAQTILSKIGQQTPADATSSSSSYEDWVRQLK
jgi:AraC-like DNA-binding protein